MKCKREGFELLGCYIRIVMELLQQNAVDTPRGHCDLKYCITVLCKWYSWM